MITLTRVYYLHPKHTDFDETKHIDVKTSHLDTLHLMEVIYAAKVGETLTHWIAGEGMEYAVHIWLILLLQKNDR